MVDNYSASTDVFVVMVKTPDLECVTYEAYAAVDLFEWVMADVPGVQSHLLTGQRVQAHHCRQQRGQSQVGHGDP